MGTPDFAVHSLDILYNAGYEIVGVITSPDRYGGRGRKTLIESDVKKYAISKQLKILQPTNLKNPEFVEELRTLKADIQVVVAFRMLPVVVWDMPPMGTYNLHGSLLPKYRGAAPINWAIIKGENITGVTSFKLKHEIDTGSILIQREIPIYPNDNAGDLHDRMKYVAADVVLESVKLIESGDFELKEQNDNAVTHAPKLKNENTRIDFNMDVVDVLNFIRGLDPYPSAWMKLGGKKMKVKKAKALEKFIGQDHDIISDNKNFISLKCNDGYIELHQLQYEGKRTMNVKEFLNGFDISGMAIM
ncbi:MAG: methionyl-tRNA formyltransferase, partial [Bacteroidia bacterium]|nr:methionyl-tRNA formyltransferase [Bacteroidia bacterium]